MVKAAASCLLQIALASDPISPYAYRASWRNVDAIACYFATEVSLLEAAVRTLLAAAILPVVFEP